jgi:regulator of RNase E activity RraA
MVKRGVAALVTDGAVRDIVGVRATGLPIWAQGAAASPSVAALLFVDWRQPIGCGGVAVYPDDYIVADQDGAVVIPAALAEHVATAGPEQERLEDWIMSEIAAGVALPGLYPANAETLARYGARGDKK